MADDHKRDAQNPNSTPKPTEAPNNVDQRPVADAPEAHNMEQSDEESQAQTVAEDALAAHRAGSAGQGGARGTSALSDSVKVHSGDETDDVQDVVDHMTQMDRSGTIDMDAYRGERSDDDDEDTLGPAGRESQVPRGAE